MHMISVEIGKKIRTFRKAKKMTILELSEMICKSKATLSKYEKGEIVVDIVTLYDIANALNIHVEQLLYLPTASPERVSPGKKKGFFSNAGQFYAYIFDGRANKLISCVFDVFPAAENEDIKVMMYMNFSDFEHYQECENTYWGYMQHYDTITNIVMTNQDTPIETISISILASFLESDTKWGLFKGISTRPLMPIAVKILFSKTRLKEDEALIKKLKISKEDIRLLKLYNMLSVT